MQIVKYLVILLKIILHIEWTKISLGQFDDKNGAKI